MGIGQLPIRPFHTPDYRRGYLCGMVRGDGHVGSYSYERPGRSHGDVHRFRLALKDFEALGRAREYLLDAGVATDEFDFHQAAGYAPIRAIRTQARRRVELVRDLIEWPRQASEDWCKGFLAGIFDAEGSFSDSLRIANTDPAIIDWITWCLRRLGFNYVVEDRGLANGLRCVRLVGGLVRQLRFLQTVDPAITRKRSIAGKALKTNARLRVESIDQLGFKLQLYDITTGTGDFIANGVVSHNCFARPTHTYLDFNAGRDFEREIVVKVNVPELLRAELARPSWKRELVALGPNTDPYQWVESRYRMMPEILAAREAAETPVSVLTKSPLVMRDVEIFERMAKKLPVSVNLSVPTLDEEAWRATEPHTPSPAARLDAVAELRARGIESGVLVAPLMPGINDAPEQVQPILDRAKEAGASFLGGVPLHLRGEVKDVFFAWLEAKRPDLLPKYEQLYKGRSYLQPQQRKRATRALKGWGRGRVRRQETAKPEPAPARQQPLF
jgi:DNA repair photolyase